MYTLSGFSKLFSVVSMLKIKDPPYLEIVVEHNFLSV